MLQVTSTARRLVVGGFIAGLFALDAIVPLGVNVPILYLVPLLVVFLTEPIRTRVLFTALVSVLVVASFAWPGKWSGDGMAGLWNRSFDLGVFVVALALSIRDARIKREVYSLRRVLDNASIVSIIDAHGVIRHVNAGFCAISKYSRSELLGRDHRVVGFDPEGGDWMRGLWPTIAAGEIWHGEVHNQAKDGSSYWLDTTVVPFLDGSGRSYQYLEIHHDISGQKRAEARLRSQAALAKIAELAALVAHEVRNPLAGMRGALQLIGDGPSLSSTERLLTQQMVDRMDLMEAHVRALLHYARPRALELHPVPIRTLLTDVAHSVNHTDHWRNIRCDIVGSDARVLGDSVMLREVFTNLFVNAAEAQSGLGTITTAIEPGSDAVNIEVADEGPGIEPALRDRVFEPFFTTKPSGAGLGLAIAKQLVELHGGDVRLAARGGPGTTVRVTIPRAPESTPPGPPLLLTAAE